MLWHAIFSCDQSKIPKGFMNDDPTPKLYNINVVACDLCNEFLCVITLTGDEKQRIMELLISSNRLRKPRNRKRVEVTSHLRNVVVLENPQKRTLLRVSMEHRPPSS